MTLFSEMLSEMRRLEAAGALTRVTFEPKGRLVLQPSYRALFASAMMEGQTQSAVAILPVPADALALQKRFPGTTRARHPFSCLLSVACPAVVASCVPR